MKRVYLVSAVALCTIIGSLISPGHALMLALGLAAGPWLAYQLQTRYSPTMPQPEFVQTFGKMELSEALGQLDLPFILLDKQARIVSANPAACAAFPALHPGQPLAMSINDPLVHSTIERAMITGRQEVFGGAANQRYAGAVARVRGDASIKAVLNLYDTQKNAGSFQAV